MQRPRQYSIRYLFLLTAMWACAFGSFRMVFEVRSEIAGVTLLMCGFMLSGGAIGGLFGKMRFGFAAGAVVSVAVLVIVGLLFVWASESSRD